MKIYDWMECRVAPITSKIINKFRAKRDLKRLKNTNFTIIAPNCIGGVIYHRLRHRFLSPTINLCFPDKKQFVKFASNLKYYLSKELKFIPSDKDYPVALCEDIQINFNHYKTEDEAREKWTERAKRVNYDNLFIIADETANFSYDELITISNIKCKGKCVLTLNEYTEFDYTVPLSKYNGRDKLGIYMEEKNLFTGSFPFDKDFDYVAWLNGEKFRKNK